MPTDAVEELWRASTRRHTPTGGTLIEQGADADHLILLLTGRATSTNHTAHGRSVVLDAWTAPAALDKVVTFSGGAHPGTIVAAEAAWWCAVPRRAVDGILDRYPGARRHVLRLIATSARQARSSFVDVATRPSLGRLAGWLIASARHDEAPMPRPQDELAHHLGMTRVTLNRGLHHLVRAGVITVERQMVTIRHRERLQGFADQA